MIHLRLAGGLGNQLFQLAAATNLSKQTGIPISVLCGGLKNYESIRQADVICLIDLKKLNAESHASNPLLTWMSVSARAGRIFPFFGINDRNFARTLTLSRAWNQIFLLDGYFQKQWQWQQFSPVLSYIYEAMYEKWKLTVQPDGDCLIHVRGGDFLNSSEHQVITNQYYTDALRVLQEKYSVRKTVVITDDSAHAKRILNLAMVDHPNVKFSFPAGSSNPINDFVLLSNAPCRIIGNSTFAWWATVLDPRQGVTVSPRSFLRGQPRFVSAPWELMLSVG